MDYKRMVGNVELLSLTDGHGKGRPTEIFPSSSEDIWHREYSEFIDEDGFINPRFGSLMVRSSGKLVVVDTGAGPPDGTLLSEMDHEGVDRNSVNLVVMTHLHPDHVGWNLSGPVPNFPNAKYLVPEADWEYWNQPNIIENNEHIVDQVVPLEQLDLMELIGGEYQITPELIAVSTPGHTPGHISIAISSAGQKGFILGDVAHSPVQANHTDWSPSFDIDGDLAAKTRHAILDRLESEKSLVSAGHFPGLGFGHFIRRDGRRYWQGC